MSFIVYMESHDENQYLQLINKILQMGNKETGRNGNTISYFGTTMRFSLQNGTLPLLTTKKLAYKTCLKELLWFLRGSTSNTELKKENVHIWDANATREFLDSRNLTHLEEDDLGPVYGHQWRHFNATYTNSKQDYTNKGIDQINYIIRHLKDPELRSSRRLIMSAWNPCQLDEMALPPCHVLCQFHVTDGNKLSCALYQRSGDVGLGVPFNIASYSYLTHLIAHHCNMIAHEFVHFIGNAHIYEDHIDALKEQCTRKPFIFPTLAINNKYENINDYTWKDFQINDYTCHPSIRMQMKA